MGEVSVKVRVQPADSFGLTGTPEIRALDLNSAATGFARLNWTRAFDFNADGTRDLLNPGADLPTPAALPIDLGLQPATAGGGHGQRQQHRHLRRHQRGQRAADHRAGGDCRHGRVRPDAPDGGRRHRRQRQRRPAGATVDAVALRLTGARVYVDGIADLDVPALAVARDPGGGATARKHRRWEDGRGERVKVRVQPADSLPA